ncbi:MAG: hypothetical protein JXA24_02560 [Proteobacteria bacterium]|nr:hypothetical protein [Pseudomonadota bacterium]
MKIESIRREVGDTDTTVVMHRHLAGGELTVSVGPEAVDMTLSVPDGGSEVIIHRGADGLAEAMVSRPDGEMRYYRLDEALNPRPSECGSREDAVMIRSAAAVFAGALDSMEGLEGFERFNPFEDEPG